MRARIIDDPFTAVLDKVFEQLQRLKYGMSTTSQMANDTETDLVDLSPLLRLLLHEASIDTWHDLVEILASDT